MKRTSSAAVFEQRLIVYVGWKFLTTGNWFRRQYRRFFFFPFFIPARLSIPAGNGNRDAWHGGCNLKILIIIENIMGKYLSVGVKQSSSVSLKFPWKWIFIYVIIYNFERERERDKRFARNDRGRGSLSPRVITARLTGISARERGKN